MMTESFETKRERLRRGDLSAPNLEKKKGSVQQFNANFRTRILVTVDIVNLQKQNCPFSHHVLKVKLKMCSFAVLSKDIMVLGHCVKNV